MIFAVDRMFFVIVGALALSACTRIYEVQSSGGSYTLPPEQMISSKQDAPTDDEIKAIISAKTQGGIKHCYEAGVKKNPNLVGRAIYEFKIASSGKIAEISLQETTLKDAMVESCIQYELTKIQFPAFNKGFVSLTYPFLFKVKQ
ncbi:MAG: AgmX/PglI C-terminal domain-containing protein [Bdellovibrionales bacterium]|nr:AgmX/PglI C-terminal domain-containing protein [Bdellovibrionales bacterium]